MKSKPIVMEHFSTVHTSYILNFDFTNNITILTGLSASGKTASFFTGKKNADLPACILLVGMSGMSDLLGSIGVEYIIGHFHGESPDSVQEFLSGRHSVFKSGKLLFPLPG